MRMLITASAASLLLIGCATPVVYGPVSAEHSNGFGYSDLRNADGSYTVRVVGSTQPQAHEFLDRRAAELCGGPNFTKNIFRADIPVVPYSGYATGANGYGGAYTEDRYAAPVLEAYIHCQSEESNQAAPPTSEAPAQQ